MLDLDHPLSRYIFEASRYEDQIRMRLVALMNDPGMDPTQSYKEIILGPLPELRRLLHERFEDRPGIASRLNAIERAITGGGGVNDVWAAFRKLDELSKDTFGTAYI